MENASLKLFNSLDKYFDMEELINEGQTEGIYLECKSPLSPNLGQGLKAQLAEAISGFANTEGGIIIWGISTTKHAHSDLDILSQIEEIGNCNNFMRQIEKNCPILTTPSITSIQNKIIKKKKEDSKGIVITYIPKGLGDPIQSNMDRHFYFRNGDEFSKLPYEVLKRLFAATESPDLYVIFNSQLVVQKENNIWEIPIIITNQSSAVGEHSTIFIEVENMGDFESISSKDLQDCSELNPGKKLFSYELSGSVIHRGFNKLTGTLIVKIKTEKKDKGLLKIKIRIYANKMRAREEDMEIYLSKEGVSVKKIGEKYLY